jgi:uncharacterized membrane protein YkvA (DUF1232 family)
MRRLHDLARRLKAETLALYFAARDPRTPWLARLLVAGLVAYALSPIDLIPDFVPVLGFLDDVVILSVGVALALRMIPAAVMAEARTRARGELAGTQPRSRAAAVAIVAIWVALAAVSGVLVWRALD